MSGRGAAAISLRELRRQAETALAETGLRSAVPTPELDARLLVCHALGLTRERVLTHPETPVAGPDAARALALVARRAAGEPVGRILGRRGFWTLDLALSPATLEPRPDTETVVEAALDAFPDRQGRFDMLDLGTGTGCILLAVLAERPNARGLGIDIAEGAVATATANASAHGLEERATFHVGNWGQGWRLEPERRFDLVVSNPPYIRRADIPDLAIEVRDHDPRAALDGGEDGLDAYRALALEMPRLSAPGGVVALEVGCGQADEVVALFSARSFRLDRVFQDLGGIPRCIRLRNDR